MNIGLDAKRIFFNHSGLGNYGRRFYRALALNLPDDRFFLYSPRKVDRQNPYRDRINETNSLIISPQSSLHKAFGGSPWRSALISKQLQKDGINIYYGLSNEIPLGSPSPNLTTVAVIHDLIFLRFPELYPFSDRFFYNAKSRYACKKADLIIAASEQTKNDIIENYGTNPDRIRVIYPSADPIFYNGLYVDSGDFFKTDRPYIISIGAITPRKNLMKTVMAFKMAREKHDLDLLVVGTAQGLGKKYLKKIMEFIAKQKLSDRVHFLGNVPYKYLPDLCRKASVMVYPSIYEGFGMPITEGLLSSIPVITSKGGCFPEAGGEAAIYVDPADPSEIAARIDDLLTSEAQRNNCIRNGLAYAARFQEEQITKEILALHSGINPA